MNALFESVDSNDSEESVGQSTQGFVLTDGDSEILRHVLEHRLLRRDQLSLLLVRHQKRVHRRLLKLSRHGYLTTLRFPQQKFIYGLDRAAVRALVEQGIAPSNLLDKRRRTCELKELFLKHEMMIVDIHVLLTIASRQGVARLVGWREGRDIYDSVRATNQNGKNRLPIRPDALFSLQDSRLPECANHRHFSLEADRSTATQTRFLEKFRAYWNYIEQGLHEKNFGAKSFRVLTVTRNDARARNLCTLAAAAMPERGRKYFLFTDIKSLSLTPDPIGTATCYSARTADSNERYTLMPTPNVSTDQLIQGDFRSN